MSRKAILLSAVVCGPLCMVLSGSGFGAPPIERPVNPAVMQPAGGPPPAVDMSGKEVPANAPMPERVISHGKLMMGIRGTQARRLSGKEAGLARDAVPGVHFVSSEEWSRMREIPKTGLFIVDADFIPGNLEATLKERGFRLEKNGDLFDSEGKPKAIFILPLAYELATKPGGGRQGWLERLQHFAHNAASGVIGEAHAGSPYYFACYGASAWLVYSNGFCRWQNLWTQGWAYGPKAGGGCGWPVPATNISSIQTWAWIHGVDFEFRSCNNCSTKNVMANWSIGCFWPAYGSVSFENYANLQDNDPSHGNPRADAYWSWSH